MQPAARRKKKKIKSFWHRVKANIRSIKIKSGGGKHAGKLKSFIFF